MHLYVVWMLRSLLTYSSKMLICMYRQRNDNHKRFVFRPLTESLENFLDAVKTRRNWVKCFPYILRCAAAIHPMA